jgi:hypothetical protein
MIFEARHGKPGESRACLSAKEKQAAIYAIITSV